MLNSSIFDAKDSVQVVFKSSPFGTQSHGYEANNSFLLSAYGKRILIGSGYRDIYGSEHHTEWMWSTRSVNNITVNGLGQRKHSAATQGRITAFRTTPAADIVVGEAGDCYEPPLERFTRAIVFVKPELVVVYDRLAAREPSTYQYWLHSLKRMATDDQHNVRVRNSDVTCEVDFLTPDGLQFTQTDQYDPNPRPRITLREWHLTAALPAKHKTIEFVTLYRIRRGEGQEHAAATLEKVEAGYVLRTVASAGRTTLLLPIDPATALTADGLTSRGNIVVGISSGGPGGGTTVVAE